MLTVLATKSSGQVVQPVSQQMAAATPAESRTCSSRGNYQENHDNSGDNQIALVYAFSKVIHDFPRAYGLEVT